MIIHHADFEIFYLNVRIFPNLMYGFFFKIFVATLHLDRFITFHIFLVISFCNYCNHNLRICRNFIFFFSFQKDLSFLKPNLVRIRRNSSTSKSVTNLSGIEPVDSSSEEEVRLLGSANKHQRQRARSQDRLEICTYLSNTFGGPGKPPDIHILKTY